MRIILTVAFCALLAGTASVTADDMTLIGVGTTPTTASGSCSNSLDFSTVCNSQYAPLM